MKDKLQHVINVFPSYEYIDTLPKDFIKRIRSRGKLQDKQFKIFLKPLSHRQYKVFSGNKYSTTVIIEVFNNHLTFRGATLSYVMKWPLLVKLIIDTVFTVSGGKLEKMNSDPQVLFDLLSSYRTAYSSIESLVDKLIINTAGIDTYTRFQKLETIEERLAFAALIEMSNDVIIEERYDMAEKTKKPINLSISSQFRKEYGDGKSDMDNMLNESQADLDATIRRDKKLSNLGITRSVNTSAENRDLSDL